MHLTPPQQCAKYIDFFKSKFRSYDPRRQTPEHIHISYHSYFLMCTIHTFIIHKLFINSCNCRTTQCLHVYYFTITQRKYTYTRNTLPQITTINIHSVTVIPPTQEDTVLGSRKNTVRVRNIAQRVNSLCFSLRSLLFHSSQQVR